MFMVLRQWRVVTKRIVSRLLTGKYDVQNDEEPKTELARIIELAVPTHHRLLTGDLVVTNDKLETRGIAVAPDGLTGSMAFFVNGQRCDEVHYPVPDDHTRRLFKYIDGAAGFMARITDGLSGVKNARFFRIDASPTGGYVEQDWRHAMWFMNPAHERYPFPPPDNIRRVVGDPDQTRFGMGGASIVQRVGRHLRDMGHDWNAFHSILDWGCGAGRITRYLLTETGATVHGADIDADNIAWCRANLAPGLFHVVPLVPPTDIADGAYDLVIGTSVLTHLTEEMQFAWLAELQRITRPGALLFLSVSGPVQFAYMGIPAAVFAAKEKAGFVDARRDGALDGQIENAEYYRTVWHSRPYIRDVWGRYFDVLAFVDGIAALQDFVVLRRR
jgi:SAM-dependent methyltransferase